MIQLPRRHFFNALKEIHYNKKRGSQLGGPIYIDGMIPEYRILTQEEINGYVTKDPVQDTIDALNAAIDRLDKIINDMKGQNDGTRN